MGLSAYCRAHRAWCKTKLGAAGFEAKAVVPRLREGNGFFYLSDVL
jgi:hypothetical protein